MVIAPASKYSVQEYDTFCTIFPISMTGITFADLKMLCRGKFTYRRDAYCAHEDTVLEIEQGRYEISGADPSTPPLNRYDTSAETIVANSLLENTQKVDDGNIPLGAPGVGINTVVMSSSCMNP